VTWTFRVFLLARPCLFIRSRAASGLVAPRSPFFPLRSPRRIGKPRDARRPIHGSSRRRRARATSCRRRKGKDGSR
jgi:hypothetical protein